MLIHPQFDPALISFGPIAVRWYALSYIVGFAFFIWLGRRRIRQGLGVMTADMLDDFLLWGVCGVILGGRLGYILFYQPAFYFAHPLEMLKIWEGGLSFHGGFLGVLAAMVLFARKHRIRILDMFDFIAPLTPLGFACVRAGGNFVNGELWGARYQPRRFLGNGFSAGTSGRYAAGCAGAGRVGGVFPATRYAAAPSFAAVSGGVGRFAAVCVVVVVFFAKTASRSGGFAVSFGLWQYALYCRVCPRTGRVSGYAGFESVDGAVVESADDCVGRGRSVCLRPLPPVRGKGYLKLLRGIGCEGMIPKICLPPAAVSQH